MAKKAVSAEMWAIKGTWSNGREFLYTGTSLFRRGAIAEHTNALGKTWAQCQVSGDRAVKVRVTEVPLGS